MSFCGMFWRFWRWIGREKTEFRQIHIFFGLISHGLHSNATQNRVNTRRIFLERLKILDVYRTQYENRSFSRNFKYFWNAKLFALLASPMYPWNKAVFTVHCSLNLELVYTRTTISTTLFKAEETQIQTPPPPTNNNNYNNTKSTNIFPKN